MSDIQSRVAKLSPQKRALFQSRLSTIAAERIPRRAGSGPSALSYAQESLWFLNRLEPESPLYNVAWAVRLSGNLNRSALEAALNAVIARHEALRTAFAAVDGQPVQIVLPDCHVELEFRDVREDEAERLIQEENRRPFDLARAPLLRARLLRLGPGEHILLITVHHIVFDGWSLGVLLRELGQYYSAYVQGLEPALPELPIQYSDFSAWQRSRVDSPALEEHLAYWKRQLAGSAAVLPLPADRPRPARQTFRGGHDKILLPPSLAGGLRELSRNEGATLHMTLAAALYTLLHRYSGQTDISIASAMGNRVREETEALIGFFVNTVVLRTDLSGDPDFRELLGRVRRTALEAFAHQDLPFEKLVEALRPERSLSYMPLVQVMLVLQNAPAATMEMSGLNVQVGQVHTGTSKFDLTLAVWETGDGLLISSEYSADLFEAATIRRFLGHFRTLLEAVVRDPGERISRLPVMAPEERDRLLVEWNDTRRDYPQRCVHELFEEQAARCPDAVALVRGEERLSYGELNRRANGLARHLRHLGVEAETLVGLCGERSPEMIAGMLGILKAGGAYLPLDPRYPPERLEFMLRDAGAQVVVVQRQFRNFLPATEIPAVYLEDVLAEESEPPAPASGSGPDSLAYVMYTSGSTGVPKGVEVLHRGIVRLLFGVDYARLGETEVFLQAATLSFDASTFEIWGALLHGGRCVLLPETVPSARDLRCVIERERVTTAWLTSSLFNAIVDEDVEALAGLRQLLTGGEALSAPHIRRALAALPGTEIVNGYGPTECTTFACCYRIPRGFEETSRSVPIGRPIANTEAFVLDARLEPVPVGVPGELYLGGGGLARGYRKRPELTAERFIANPFGPGRLYKTGDLVRYRSDGNLEFVARLDDQVKIRGFRVELGEVEAQLASHPGVKAGAVAVREAGPGDKRLIAYVVRAPGRACTSEELRAYLKQKLPDYMVPSSVHFLASLPLNGNGKVDRKILPAAGDCEHTPLHAEDGAPAAIDAVQFRLAKIWEKLLGIEQVDVRENFFDLGGHSLMAARLVAEIDRTFGKTLPVALLFEYPTIKQLAALLVRDEPIAIPRVIAVQSAGCKPPFFCVHAEALFRPLARSLGFDRPLLGLRADTEAWPVPYRLKDIVTAHVSAIRAVQPEGPYFLGGFCFDGIIAYEIAQRLRAEGQRVALLVLFDAPNPARGRGPQPGLARKVSFHFDNLRRLGPGKEALQYIGKRITTRVSTRLWEASYWFHVRAGLRVDGRLRDRQEIVYNVCRAHVPQPYPGRVVLFRSEPRVIDSDATPELGWGDLVKDLEVHRIPGDHYSIFQEPHVKVMAAKLHDCLAATRYCPES